MTEKYGLKDVIQIIDQFVLLTDNVESAQLTLRNIEDPYELDFVLNDIDDIEKHVGKIKELIRKEKEKYYG